MEVRHNTKLLEEAIALVVERAEIPIRQAVAAAAAIQARAIARRRLATGAAIGIAAVGIGLAVWLVRHSTDKTPIVMREPYPVPGPTVTVTAEPRVAAKPIPTVTVTVTPTPTSTFAATPFPTPSVEAHPPLLNFTKFASQKVFLFGREWDIEAGHQYATEDQKDWGMAWCYANSDVDGIPARVDLAQRPTPYSAPLGPIASADTFQRLGLGDDQATQLASRCPWLDGRYFSPTELLPAPNRIPSRPQPPGATPFANGPPTPVTGNSTSPLPSPDSGAPAPNSFSVSEGYDAIGNDLPGMPLDSPSLDDCENDCLQNQTCNAFTFNKKHNKCFLKDRSRIIVPSIQAITGYKSNADGSRGVPVTSQMKTRGRSAVTGRSYQTITLESFDLCLVTCERNSASCAGANFDMSTSECSLFSYVTGSTIAPTMESGERVSSR